MLAEHKRRTDKKETPEREDADCPVNGCDELVMPAALMRIHCAESNHGLTRFAGLQGRTPLHFACRYGQMTAAHFLLGEPGRARGEVAAGRDSAGEWRG